MRSIRRSSVKRTSSPRSPRGAGKGRRFAVIPLAFGLVLALLSGNACIQPAPRPNEGDTRPTHPVRGKVLSWQKYRVGSHRGYLEIVEGPGGSIHRVYDEEVKLIGFFTSVGATYIVQGREEPELLGRYDTDDSLRALCGVESLAIEVHRMPMDQPLTIEDLDAGESEGTEEPDEGQ